MNFSGVDWAEPKRYVRYSSSAQTPSNNTISQNTTVDKEIEGQVPTSDTGDLEVNRRSIPEFVRPLPKIAKTALKKKGKEKGKSRIYTGTPERKSPRIVMSKRIEKTCTGTEATCKRIQNSKKVVRFVSRN